MNHPTCRILSPHPSIECVRTAGHNGQHRSYRGRTWTDEPADYADGGVTAAAIETEVVSPERARSLVQERDAAKDMADLWKRTAREQIRRTRTIAGRTVVQADYIGRLLREREEEPQQTDVDPLPIINEVARQDGVIHELREQLVQQSPAVIEKVRPMRAEDITLDMCRRAADEFEATRSWEAAMTAALTEPQRPEGAEEIEAHLAEYIETSDERDGADARLSDYLAERGVRVTGDQS